MFRIISLIILLLFFNDEKIIFFQGSFEEAKDKAQVDDKLLLLFFAAGSDDAIIQQLNKDPGLVNLCNSFINILVEHNSNEWNLLTKLYTVDSSRAVILCSSNGKEIDRIYSKWDFENAKSLLQSYSKNEKTLDYYLKKLENDSSNDELLSIIASKYLDRGRKEKALDIYVKLMDKNGKKGYQVPEYPYYLISMKRLAVSNTSAATGFIGKYPASKYINQVYLGLADFYIRTEDFKKARNVYDEYLKKFPNDPAALNNFAYLSTLFDPELSRAMSAIEKALILTKDNYSKAVYLDTKAEIFFKLKKYKEAVETEEFAIEILGNENKELINNLTQQLNKFRKFIK